MNEITSFDHMIYRRDVLARIAELEGTTDADERAKLATLRALDNEAAARSTRWREGRALTRCAYLNMDIFPALPDYVTIAFRGRDFIIHS